VTGDKRRQKPIYCLCEYVSGLAAFRWCLIKVALTVSATPVQGPTKLQPAGRVGPNAAPT
jgi:hypothetical protein